MQAETRKRIARLLSGVLNPFSVSPVVVVLLALKSTSPALDALKWALIAIALSILPVFLVILYLVRTGRLDEFFASVRQQRTKVYLVAILCGIVGYIVLTYLSAPSILLAAFTAGLVIVVVFMFINLLWKISVHTVFIAASATALVMLHGWVAVVTVPLVPLLVWARVELKQHSLAQAVAGAVLGALIVAIVFYPFVLA